MERKQRSLEGSRCSKGQEQVRDKRRGECREEFLHTVCLLITNTSCSHCLFAYTPADKEVYNWAYKQELVLVKFPSKKFGLKKNGKRKFYIMCGNVLVLSSSQSPNGST